MIRWEQIDKSVNRDGSTITYKGVNPENIRIFIQSRKRHIPHSGRSGTWDHTTYFVLWNEGSKEKEFWRLSDAKEFAETLLRGDI